MFSLLEGLQQSAPTAAAAAPAAEAMTGTRVFPDVLSEGVAEAPTSSAGAASTAVPATAPATGVPTTSVGGAARAPAPADETAAWKAAPATGGTVFPTTSVGGATRAPAPADKTAASKATPTASGTVTSTTPLRGAVGARESSAGAASSDALAEAAPSTGDTAAPDASVERAAIKRTSAAGPFSTICGERRAFRYHKSSGNGSYSNSSNSSKSSGNGSRSSSNDATSNHDSWWEAIYVGAMLKPFDPGKRCRWSARRGKAVLGMYLPFDRGKSWGRMQHGG